MHSHRHHRDENRWGRETFKPLFNMAQQVQGLVSAPVDAKPQFDVRAALLLLLTEQAMHGYQLIQEINQRSEGVWSPSPGLIYPNLQLLVDEGLAFAEPREGKKVYQLTEEGNNAAAPLIAERAPWDHAGDDSADGICYQKAATGLIQAALQVRKTGTAQQISAAADAMNDTRKRLYAILAED